MGTVCLGLRYQGRLLNLPTHIVGRYSSRNLSRVLPPISPLRLHRLTEVRLLACYLVSPAAREGGTSVCIWWFWSPCVNHRTVLWLRRGAERYHQLQPPPLCSEISLGRGSCNKTRERPRRGGRSMCPQRLVLHVATKRLKGISVSGGQDSMRPQLLVTRLAGSPRPLLQRHRRRGDGQGEAQVCPAWLSADLCSARVFAHMLRLEEPLLRGLQSRWPLGVFLVLNLWDSIGLAVRRQGEFVRALIFPMHSM